MLMEPLLVIQLELQDRGCGTCKTGGGCFRELDELNWGQKWQKWQKKMAKNRLNLAAKKCCFASVELKAGRTNCASLARAPRFNVRRCVVTKMKGSKGIVREKNICMCI
jgi:hypothetical protein